MRSPYTISALGHKRAKLAGEIEVAELRLAKQRETPSILDATLRLFHSDVDPSDIASIRPQARRVLFRDGEQARLCREALADTGTPLPNRLVTEYVMRAKGLDIADKGLRTAMVEYLRRARNRLAEWGIVRWIITEPELWWELVGAAGD
jgi:hypothetical protein